MDHLTDSAAELRQGGMRWYVDWLGIQINNCPWENVHCNSLWEWESVSMKVDVCILIAYGKPFYYLLCKVDILYVISDILYRI